MVSSGNLFTSQFSNIARACERLPADTLLDGEIVAIDKSGRISFNLLQHHRSHAHALLFYAFDVIVCRGKSLVSTPLEKRRTLLNEIFEDLGKNASPICLSEMLDTAPADLIRAAKEFGFEGIVAKRKTSLYEPGKRSGAWLKYRINKGAGVCHWRIHPRQSIRFNYRWLLPRRKIAICRQGAERVRIAHAPRSGGQTQRLADRPMSLRQPT